MSPATSAPACSPAASFRPGQGRKIALYFTGRQHAGENIADVLKQRAEELGPAIQMCDALSWNMPKLPGGVEVLVAHCLAHGRRQIRGSRAELSRGVPLCAGDNWARCTVSTPRRATRPDGGGAVCASISSTASR